MPLIAVVLPVYNVAPYLKEAVDSILNQTIQDFEVIIIDDCSTDKTIEVANTFNDSRIKIITKEKNKGLIDSLNIGFKTAKGKYIARMDGDDISDLKRFEKQLNVLENNPEIKVCGCWLQAFGNNDEIIKHKEHHEQILVNMMVHCSMSLGAVMIDRTWVKDECFNEEKKHVEEKYAATYLKKLKGTTRSSLSENIFKRKMYTKHGFHNYPLAWNSDDRAWFDFSESKPIFTINEAMVYVSVSEESISGMDNNLEIKNRSQALFYSYLLWGFKLNFAQKVEISYLILNLQKNSVSYFTRLHARILIKISRILNK